METCTGVYTDPNLPALEIGSRRIRRVLDDRPFLRTALNLLNVAGESLGIATKTKYYRVIVSLSTDWLGFTFCGPNLPQPSQCLNTSHYDIRTTDRIKKVVLYHF